MTAKKYLSQIQWYRDVLEEIEQNVEELDTKAQGLKAQTYDQDRVQVSTRNLFEEAVIALDAEKALWANVQVEYQKALRLRIEQIKDMDKPLYAELLKHVYIDGLSLRMATAKIQLAHPDRVYGEGYIRQVHGWALDAFDKKYKISPKYNQI